MYVTCTVLSAAENSILFYRQQKWNETKRKNAYVFALFHYSAPMYGCAPPQSTHHQSSRPSNTSTNNRKILKCGWGSAFTNRNEKIKSTVVGAKRTKETKETKKKQKQQQRRRPNGNKSKPKLRRVYRQYKKNSAGSPSTECTWSLEHHRAHNLSIKASKRRALFFLDFICWALRFCIFILFRFYDHSFPLFLFCFAPNSNRMENEMEWDVALDDNAWARNEHSHAAENVICTEG